MPVTADSFLWEATGLFSLAVAGDVVVTHPDAGGTTAGTSVVVVILNPVLRVATVPSGFISASASNATELMFIKPNVAGGETSWTFAMSGPVTGHWYVAEVDDVMLEDPFDGISTGGGGTVANGATSTTVGVANGSSSGVALAIYSTNKAGASDVQSWSDWTNGFAERVDVMPPGGSTGRGIAVAWKAYDGWSTMNTVATFSTSAASAGVANKMFLLRSADASINAPLNYLTTFGFGTHAGMGSSYVGTASTSTSPLAGSSGLTAFPAGTWGTNYRVGAYGRDGRTGLEVVCSASVANVNLPRVDANVFAFGGNVQAVSGSGTPEALRFESILVSLAAGPALSLLYDVTNEKFGLQWEGGTTVWQTGTTPTGTHVWVDVRIRMNASTFHADWSVETGTGDGSQTAPADLTGQSSTLSNIRPYLGGLSSQTATFRYSDIVYSRYSGAYPLGPHVVRVLVPETTGSTVSGTSTNFSRFTANGTLATLTADTVGALLDDIPPTISASSDGIVQTAVAASDYVQVAMTTYTLASDEIIAGVRAFASLWGGTGSGTGTLGFRGYDGTTETTFIAASTSFDPDSLTTASATYPMWHTAMWSAGTAWNQTKLDAAALRGGFSTDATPDMGFSCMGLEVATRQVAAPVVVHRLTSDEDPEAVAATVTERLHPYSSGVRTYTVSNDDLTRTAEFRFYETGGAEHADSPVVVAPLDPPVDVTVGADAFGEIESTTFGWQ